jgi:hypothetical protein
MEVVMSLAFLLTRLREPSSLGGVGLIVTGIQTLLMGETVVGVAQVLSGIAAVLVSERQS